MDSVYINKQDLNKWIAKYFNKDLISIEDMLGVIEDLDNEVDVLKEKIEDLERDIKENYILKPFDPWEEYGLNRKDYVC